LSLSWCACDRAAARGLLRCLLELRHLLVKRLRMFCNRGRSLRTRHWRRLLQYQNDRDQRRHQRGYADDPVNLEFLHKQLP
jgi:hypothetical protein